MKKTISIKRIKQQLESSISRDEINAELQLNPVEIKALWNHPELKGLRKAKYKNELEFEEENPETLQNSEESSSL